LFLQEVAPLGHGSPPVPASPNPQGSELAHQLTRERDRLRLLLDVSSAVVSNLSLRDLLKSVSACLRQFFNHDFASVVLYDEDVG
jgi:transcriptional regulator with GAF, ATPase, and Fis domain